MGNRHPQVRISTLSRSLMLSLAVMAGGAVPSEEAWAEAQPAVGGTVEFDIPAGDLATALDRVAEQSGLQIISDQPMLQGLKSPAVRGRYTPEEALRRLLQQGSGFVFERLDAQTIVLKKRPPAPRSEQQSGTRNPSGPASSDEPEALDLERVTVTGTRIRGGSTPSPVIAIDALQIQQEGFADLGDVVRSIPQNYSGGQNPGVIPFNIAGAGVQNSNVTGGSALNLRGLGPDASLTLLNGRRMAYDGFVQAVDVSAIPAEAVQRIEVIADGASAIYGSDAVGGVANVILKRDFDGYAVGTRYGSTTGGGLTTREYTATAGRTWASGGLIATYKDVSVDPIYASERPYTDQLRDPYTVYPESDLRSGLLSLHQAIGDVAELHLDALKSDRDQAYTTQLDPGNLESVVKSQTATYLVSPSIDFFLPNDWTMSVGGAWGKDEHDQRQSVSSVLTGNVVATTEDCFCNDSRMFEVGAEGPVLTVPAGDVRLAIGAGYRTNKFQQVNHLVDVSSIKGRDSSRFAYAELNVPVLGPQAPEGGNQRLEFTAALRGEDYDSFGKVRTPKLGVIYGPSSDFTLKASWGKSFKAPTLVQLYRDRTVYLDFIGPNDGFETDGVALISSGGNRDLEPERARTWTASVAFHPDSLPGFESELTWFSVKYTGRVVEPINWAFPLTDPVNAEFVAQSPTAEAQAAFIDDADAFLNRIGAPYDPSQVVAIVNGHFVNAIRQDIKGVDLSAMYRVDIGPGRLAVHGAASWLDSSQQTTDATAFDLAGTLHNPPRTSARIGAVWTQGGFTASAFANYKAGVRNIVHDEKTASFTTVDATLRYATDAGEGGLSGWDFALSAQNLLDRDPPLHTPITAYAVPPYDATNYSAIGRFLSLSVSKRW